MIDKQLVGYLHLPKEHEDFDMQQRALLETGINPLNIFIRQTIASTVHDVGLLSAVKACLPNAVLLVWGINSIGYSVNKRHDILEGLELRDIELAPSYNQMFEARVEMQVNLFYFNT